MPKWKEGETEFNVKVGHHDTRGEQIYIPKPIIKLLNNPDYVKFIVDGKKITIGTEKQ